jgi:hypothetical protein
MPIKTNAAVRVSFCFLLSVLTCNSRNLRRRL